MNTRDAADRLVDAILTEPTVPGVCDCEEYDCTGQCCGTGRCTCTPGFSEAVAARTRLEKP
ncbi:hypothetical protein ACIBCR_15610 [Micromonospora echinospora]|uniref:hypothetical protein n=1 Tax=Micromonospora echinospora TaxID=1877 RepID=UPI00378A331C